MSVRAFLQKILSLDHFYTEKTTAQLESQY